MGIEKDQTSRVERWAVVAALGTLGSTPATPRIEFLDVEDWSGGVLVVVDADDDDENGVADAEQPAEVPLSDAHRFRVRGTRSLTLSVSGPIRLLLDGRPLSVPYRVRPRDRGKDFAIQGTRIGTAALRITSSAGAQQIPIHVVQLSFLRGRNRSLRPHTDAVRVSRRVTNDATIPRGLSFDSVSDDPANIRVEIRGLPGGSSGRMRLLSADAALRKKRSALPDLALQRNQSASSKPVQSHATPLVIARTKWIRLVGDRMDETAPGVRNQVLRVALRDHVEARYVSKRGVLRQSIRVGRPTHEESALAARRATLRLRVLRMTRGGTPTIGGNERRALELAREQVRIANEIWLQCAIDFGAPTEADIAVVSPPPPALLSIANDDGLPAAGDGEIAFRVNGKPLKKIPTRAGAHPVETAADVARALSSLGFSARVTENARTEFGAGRSADVLVRARHGALATLTPDRSGDGEISSDSRQKVSIGQVDLSDGLQDFNNMNAATGTLEERTLLKSLADDDPATIDVFVVNRFTSGTRQGEAYIEGDGGALVNMVILDRNGILQQHAAWTQAHEIGHVLLNHPLHPDHVGPDRPWLLMDSDTSRAVVTGPKRLTQEECFRVRDQSGVQSVPALLSRHPL